MAVDKVSSTEKTELFKAHLQDIFEEYTGQKLSKATAWSLWKALQRGTLRFVLEQEDKKLSLAGIGKFQVMYSSPKNEQDKPIPRFKYYPSTSLKKAVLKYHGFEVEGEVPSLDEGLFAPEEPAVKTN